MKDQSILPLILAEIRSVMNVVGHELGDLGNKDYFIWEKSLHFTHYVINKYVKHTPTEVCFISALAFARCFW